jgi:hypothetical protein
MLTLCTARLVLNYKNIEYVTMWTEYPEIAPTFKNVYDCSNNHINLVSCTDDLVWTEEFHLTKKATLTQFQRSAFHVLLHPNRGG